MAKFIKIIDRDRDGIEREVLYPWDASSQSPITNAFNVQTVYSESVTLTDAQIKALPTTAINILPAPGAGMVNLVQGALFRTNFAAAYTNLSATAFLNVVWDAANNYINATVSTDTSERDTLFGADTCLVYCPAYVLLAEGITSPVGFVRATGEFGEIVNTTVDVGAGNGVSGNFTGGNAANTLKVTVYYSPIEV